MESGSTSYSVYPPGITNPTRPPLRRAAPEHARSGFPFLIGMAALVLAAAIGSVAKFCPQDLRFESGGRHPAKTSAASPTAPSAPAIANEEAPPTPAPTVAIITPTSFTTVSAPAEHPPTANKRKTGHATRGGGLPVTRGSTTASPPSSASTAPSSSPAALPDNPYAQPSSPDTYGF